MRGFRYQQVSLRISHKGQRVYFNAESHKDYTLLKGIALSIGYESALFGSTFGFRVNEKKILDESHEAHLLVFGNDVPPNQRMMFFEAPVPLQASKLEGIYTDSALQALLGNTSYSPGGGVIPPAEVNIKKTFVSGKDIVSYSPVIADAILIADNTGVFTGGGGLSSGGAAGSPDPSNPVQVYYPYDVRITMYLSK